MMPVFAPFGNVHPDYGDMRLSMHDESIQQNHIYAGGGFSFQRRHGKIDWKKLAAVDVDQISRNIDVQMLQDNVEHVAFCDIESELGLKDSDTNLRKLFKLAQLLIEYLLHSQEYLQGYISHADAQLQKFAQDQSNLQTELDKKNNMYRSLKKEYQKSKRLISEYQLMLRAGASGMHKCSFCAKSFLNEEFLKSHILRRHADQNVQASTPGPQRMMANFSVTEQPNMSANNEELLRELNLLTTRLKETESRMIAEREERDRKYEAEREYEMKRLQEFSRNELTAKDREISELKVMIEQHRDMFTKEISNLSHEKILMQKEFDQLRQNQVSKPSMLGNLQDVSVEERHEEEIVRMKEQLQKELNASYQEEMRNLRNKEELMKKAHNEELAKVRRILSKYENALEKAEAERQDQARYLEELERYKQSMDEQTKKMVKWEEMMKSQSRRVAEDEDMIEETKLQQEERLASTSVLKHSLDAPKDIPDSDEYLVLYVASNSRDSFRVWKTPSRSQSEWKDSFNFKANAVEEGQFNVPIYVYCASGSPYWRQYVSSSSKPPRPSYKLDFVFYVSNVQLKGAFKLHVLQAGSGQIVRSMISKSEIYPGWKQMGLSFFVMKGPSPQGIIKSVSFQSTLNESEVDSADEVSVSSYTGTEDAKRNLAVAIAKGREDLKEPVEEEKVDVIREDDTLVGEEEVDEDEEDKDDDISFDETDGKLTTMESTSQWGSTLLQTGSYLPFPHNTLAVARYNHTKEMIQSCRDVAIEVLASNLGRRGIDPEARGMKSDQYDSKMKLHENEVNTAAKDNPDAVHDRKRLMEALDQIARDMAGIPAHAEESKTPDKSRSKFKSAVNKIKNATIFGRTSPRKKEDGKHKLKDSSSRPSSFISEPPSPKTPKLSQSSRSIEETAISGKKFSAKPERESDGNDEIFDRVSDNVKWDSDESEALSDESLSPAAGSAQLPKVTVTQPGKSNYEPSPSSIPMRQPRGEKVRALTASLEASLMARQGIKKPAGAVDIHATEDTEDMSDQRTQEKFGGDFDDNGDFDDDDDDFDLSSLDEEDYRELARPRKDADDSFTATSQPSPYLKTSLKPPVEKTSILKFSDEDFDSDID